MFYSSVCLRGILPGGHDASDKGPERLIHNRKVSGVSFPGSTVHGASI